MNIVESTASYERWLDTHLTLVPEDLERKHALMAQGLFAFLRATFYRWIECWPAVCGPENRAPEILSVGDLHVENFGTWRDAEGRLAWGVNDFDEACELPYTQDLTRLATSAHIAIQTAKLRLDAGEACDAILEGYSDGLRDGARPFVLEEHHGWLRELVLGELRKPARFWANFDALKDFEGKVPASARKAIERYLPSPAPPYRIVHRIAGLGSLGRERFAAIFEHCGGKIAREAKASAPSACEWAGSGRTADRFAHERITRQSGRAADPFFHLQKGWIVRRLSPHCCRIELTDLGTSKDERRLLLSMGYEVANIHLRTPGAGRKIQRDLTKRSPGWLHGAAKNMLEQVKRDWNDWRTHENRESR